jgi:hypothetical protein
LGTLLAYLSKDYYEGKGAPLLNAEFDADSKFAIKNDPLL